MSWTSADYWSSWKGSKSKADYWEDRARQHLNRKKPCEDCARDQELYGSMGCGIYHDYMMKSEKWGADAEHSRYRAREKEKEEGKPLTVDGVKTDEEVRREMEADRAERDRLWREEQERLHGEAEPELPPGLPESMRHWLRPSPESGQ